MDDLPATPKVHRILGNVSWPDRMLPEIDGRSPRHMEILCKFFWPHRKFTVVDGKSPICMDS